MSDVQEVPRIPGDTGWAPQAREGETVNVSETLKALKAGKVPPSAAPAEPEAQPEQPEAEKQPEESADKRPSKRAKSQQADPEDVPRIRQLTARLREAEQRNSEWEGRFKDLEARIPKPAPKPAEIPEGFTDKEPVLGSNEYPQYEDWLKAWTRWDRSRENFSQQQVQQKQATEQQTNKDWESVTKQYQERATKFAETATDFEDVVSRWSEPEYSRAITPLLDFTFRVAENGPQLAYELAKPGREALLYEVSLLTAGKPINEASVASLQRLLTVRTADARSGSSAIAPPVSRAQPPIKPVSGGSPSMSAPRLEELSVDQMAANLRKTRRVGG